MARATSPSTTGTAMATVDRILCPSCHQSNLRRAKFCQYCRHDMVLNNDGPRYYITRVLKVGGQGAVFETIGDDNQVYAVKEMIDRFTDPKERQEAIERFEAEADMLRRLSHPRIPKVYVDFKDEGRQYLAMEFVRGQDLEDVIQKQGALPEAQVLEWADQICDVLSYLHEHKPEPIIFRDMKPSNIMIQSDNSIKLIDFGIAKVFQKAERGTQIGTPGYAPPEQYQGLATIESDIYALGATLHHALTGRDPRDEAPFSFPQVYALRPTVSKRTSEAIHRALQMKPEDRYHSVAEFRAALRPTPAQPPRVRVTPANLPVSAQPQVAAPTAPVTPAAQAKPTAPVAQARPAPRTQPVPAPTAPTNQRAQPAPVVAPTAKPTKRRGGFRRFLFTTLVVVVLAIAGLAYFQPALLQGIVTEIIAGPTPTPATFIMQPFSVTDLEIIVPPGVQVNDAFRQAYLQKAQEAFGPDTQINNNIPPTYLAGAEPVKTGDDPQGTRYRASVTGYILVRQR